MTTSEKIKDEKNTALSFLKRWNELKNKIVWKYVILHISWHLLALYGFLTFPYLSHKLTVLWLIYYYIVVGFGVTAGAHRYWTHRSFKAKLPLRLIMAACYYSAGMLKLRDWVRVHRVHHKFTDTDADPHNAKRGFIFSHIGWLMQKRHPEYYRRVKEIDMSDIDADLVVTYGDRFFLPLTLLFTFILPALVPIFLWNEHWYYAFMSQSVMRYIMILNATTLVNSAAHLYGSKPFNKHIMPSNNYLVQTATLGEGFHNYHHVFPWDYRAGEMFSINLNLTKFVIDQYAKLGWAYDRKIVSDELIREVCKKRGDDTYKNLWEEVPAPN